MLPVVANIMMINVFFHIRVGAECMAAFLLGLLLVLPRATEDTPYSSATFNIGFSQTC